MPDRYSEAEVEAMRGTRPHPLAHVIDPRIVQFNEERRRWIATLDAIKAERDRAVEALRKSQRRTSALLLVVENLAACCPKHLDANCECPQSENARETLARVEKGGA